MYCKHCGNYLPSRIKRHRCVKKGLLDVTKGDKFLIETYTIEEK